MIKKSSLVAIAGSLLLVAALPLAAAAQDEQQDVLLDLPR